MVGTMAAIGIGVGGLVLGLIVGLVVHMILKARGLDVSEEIEETVADALAELLQRKEDIQDTVEYYQNLAQYAAGSMKEAYKVIITTAEQELKEVLEEIEKKLPHVPEPEPPADFYTAPEGKYQVVDPGAGAPEEQAILTPEPEDECDKSSE